MQKRRLGSNALEVSAIGYGAMGLTGTYGATVDRQEGIRVIRAAVDRGVSLVDTAEAYGPFTNEAQHATAAQIALAWLLARKPWIVPIPGTRNLSRLEENLGAASIELTPDDLRDVNDAASKIPVQGARLPEEVLKLTNR
ncbi:MAG TPA: aldo/keto reductase [Vicinamibacterales bacterium]|nr:aldo/keto reductase [Vicinamibacterales bacterium]